MGWSENRAPKDRLYRAAVIESYGYSSQRVTSESASVTVEHEAVDLSTTLTSAPSSIEPSQTSVLTARVGTDLTWLPPDYRVEIYDVTDGANVRLATCMTVPCTATVSMTWSENRAPKDRVYQARLFGSYGYTSQYLESESLTTTVAHRAVDLSTALDASPASIDPSQSSLLTATVGSGSGSLPPNYQVTIYDITDGGHAQVGSACTTKTCTATVAMTWKENRTPKDRVYRAELMGNVGYTSTYLESQSGPITVGHRAADMATTLSASPGSIEAGRTSLLTARVASALPADYRLFIYDITDGSRAPVGTSCTTQTCTATVSMPISENPAPKDRVYRAELVGSYGYTSQYLEAQSDAVIVEHRTSGEQYGARNDAQPGRTHCAKGDPINCTTGNFYEEHLDLVIAGRGPGLESARAYNAMAAAVQSGVGAARMGPGWTHRYAQRLEIAASGVVLHGANDATAAFITNPDGSFAAAERVKARLTRGAGDSYVVTYRDQTTRVFDSVGRLVRLQDRNDYATTLSYTAAGRLDAVTDAGGRRLTYDYDAAGRIASITDPAARRVLYGYDAAGDLISVTDVAGGVTRYGYDSRHRIVSMTDPRGNQTTNEYDAQDRVTRQTDPLGGETLFAYTATSTTVTDPRGSVTRYEHNGAVTTRVIRAVGTPLQSTVSMLRDASGNVTRRIDPDAQITRVTYNSDGLPTKLTDPLARETTITYTTANDPQTITDPVATTTMTYDSRGNLTAVSRPLLGTSQTATTTHGYDPDRPGDLIATTDPNGKVWRYSYDTDGNQVSQTDPEGNRTTIAYNQIGWAISTTSPRGNRPGGDPVQFTTTIAHNDFGDIVRVEDPLGRITETTYDANRNSTSVKTPDAKITRTIYDALDRPTTVTRPDDSMLRFGYDAAGNRTSVKDGLQHETTFVFDALDRVTREVDALNRATTYAYDASGRQTSTEDATGRTTTLTYDDASQLTKVDYADSQTADVTYAYDGLGRRTRMTDASGTSTYSYDSLGRLTATNDGADRTLGYSYDLAGQVTKITYPATLVAQTAPGQTISDPSVHRGYDGAGRLTSITDWLGDRTEYDYDANANLTAQRYPNTTSAALSYDRGDQLTQRSDTGPTGAILDLPYTRNTLGQIQTHNETATQPAATATLAYDARQQLEGVTVAGQTTASYAHDLADRLTRIDSATTATALAYDTANQLTRTFNPANGNTRATYSYDQLGNRTRMQPAASSSLLPTPPATTYSYDQANQLTRVYKPAGSALDAAIDRSYSYDGDGLRADLLWDHTGDLPLILADNQALYITGPDGLPLQRLGLDATRRYYHHDQLGSTRALTTTTGTVATRTDYDAYGNPTAPATASNPFGYAGQYTDTTTGLIYMRARWYDPQTGQFITSDPIGHASGETNLYRYAGGDPANRTDPTGLDYRDAAWGWLSDRAEEASAFYAAITLDECASWVTRTGAWAGGVLSSLATRGNRDLSLAILLGRNAKQGGSRILTDLPGGRSTAKSIFRNRTRGQRVEQNPMRNGGVRRTAEDGTQIRMNRDGSTRIDIPHSSGRETIHFP